MLDEKARPRKPDLGKVDYGLSVRAAVRGLWRSETDQFLFVDDMVATINRNFTRAFQDGAAECGILPEDFTFEERAALEGEINAEIGYLVSFSNDIMQANRRQGGRLTPLIERTTMWQNAYERVRNLGRAMACADQKLQWRMGACREHCVDCSRLNGRVYRGSTWYASGWMPKSAQLACGGFRCCCDLFVTDLPVSRQSL